MLREAFEAAFPNHKFDWAITGQNAKAFCPFHNDKHSKSMGIYIDAKGRERWHCFADDIGGGLMELVLRSGIEGTNTIEGANLWLIQNGFLQESEQQVKDRIRNDAMTKFYAWTNGLLCTSEAAAGLRCYIAGRHIDLRTLPTAPIGFYPTIPEVEAWLAAEGLTDILGPEVIPQERKLDSMVTGSFLMFYRHSYKEFGRIKARNVLREREGKKVVMFLGKKLKKGESQGYFSWNMTPCVDNTAIIVEGEFDVAALSSMIFQASEEATEPIYSFGGGGNLDAGIGVLTDMGKEVLYLMPDNDEAGLDYAYSVAEKHPQTFIIVPKDYKKGADPATWAADHTVEDLDAVYNGRRPAFAWIGQKLADTAAHATVEEQSRLKLKFIEYAKRLPATDREAFVKNYGSVAGISPEALLEEIQDRSDMKYRKILSGPGFGIQMKVQTAKGGTEWEQLSNTILEIEKDVILDAYDDTEPEREIMLRATMINETRHISIPADDYIEDRKLYLTLVKALGSKFWHKPKSMAYIRDACTLLSTPEKNVNRKEEKVYTHTGWRDGRFYSPTGYIDEDGFHELTDVSVELPPNPAFMRNYHLDDPPSDLEFIKGIIRNEMLKVFPYSITLPFIAHVFWSTIAEFIPMAKPVCLWVVGLTGSFKTSFTGLMASFFGDFKTGDFETWRSTTNTIEKNGYYLKDVIYVVDDYKGIDVNPKSLTSCIQNYGDRHGRGRMGADLNIRKTWYIRGNLISTAEDVPTGEASVISRIMLLKIPGRGNSDHLSAAQKYAYMLPGVMSKFIQFLCQKHIREHDYEQLLAERRNMFRAIHGRVAESLAENSIAWDLVAEFFGFEDLTPQYYDGLDTILKTMNTTTQEEQAGYVFVSTLTDLLNSGLFYLQGAKGMDDTDHLETAKPLGWITPQAVYILGTQALAEVNRIRQLSVGNGLKYTATAIYDQLLASELIVGDSKGHPTKVIKLSNRSVRVIEFKRGVVEGYEETGDSTKPTSAVIRER